MVTFQINKHNPEVFESYKVSHEDPPKTLIGVPFQELKEQIHFVYSCVSLPQHALNLCRVNLAQKLQIVTIVSWENILHTSPSLLVFHSFHLNHNLFFLLLATPYSSPHILDTLVLTISIFSKSPISNHPTEANI